MIETQRNVKVRGPRSGTRNEETAEGEPRYQDENQTTLGLEDQSRGHRRGALGGDGPVTPRSELVTNPEAISPETRSLAWSPLYSIQIYKKLKLP